MKRLVEMVYRQSAALLWLLAAAFVWAGIRAPGAWWVRLAPHASLVRFDGLPPPKAEGEAAKAAKQRPLTNEQRRVPTMNTTIASLRADVKRMLTCRAGSRFVPAAPPVPEVLTLPVSTGPS